MEQVLAVATTLPPEKRNLFWERVCANLLHTKQPIDKAIERAGQGLNHAASDRG